MIYNIYLFAFVDFFSVVAFLLIYLPADLLLAASYGGGRGLILQSISIVISDATLPYHGLLVVAVHLPSTPSPEVGGKNVVMMDWIREEEMTISFLSLSLLTSSYVEY
jgi:hypothetical protein